MRAQPRSTFRLKLHIGVGEAVSNAKTSAVHFVCIALKGKNSRHPFYLFAQNAEASHV
jgi:hypothetical protein